MTLEKTFAVCTVRVDNNEPRVCQISYRLLNTTTLRIERNASGADAEIAWQVVESPQLLKVERGSFTLTDSVTTDTVTLTDQTLDLSKSFLIASYRVPGTGWDQDDFIRWQLIDDGSKKVQFDAQEVVGNSNVIEWQVIEYQKCSVQRGSVNIIYSDTSVTDTLIAVDTDKSFPIISYDYALTDETNMDEYMIRSRITSSTQITIDKQTAGGSGTVNWEVVELSGNSSVQHANETFGTSDTIINALLGTPVVIKRSFALTGGFVHRSGKTTYTTDDNPVAVWATLELTTVDMDITRAGTGSSTTELEWYVISLETQGSSSSSSQSSSSSSSRSSSSSSRSSSSSQSSSSSRSSSSSSQSSSSSSSSSSSQSSSSSRSSSSLSSSSSGSSSSQSSSSSQRSSSSSSGSSSSSISSSSSSLSSSSSRSSSSSSSDFFVAAPEQLPRTRENFLVKDELSLTVQPGDIMTTWSDPAAIVQDFTVFPIRIQKAGEIIYTGTTFHEILGQTTADQANFVVKVQILGTRNLRFDLKTRRQDANNFIALRVDFPASTLKLVKVQSGTETTLAQSSRTFEYLGIHVYTFEIWGFGRFLYGFINNYNAFRASEKLARTEPGLSLNFPTIDTADMPAIFNVGATETFAQTTPPLLTDTSDLYLQFRLDIKEEIENPTTLTWATFQRALKLYEQRNVGLPDRDWEALGYPIRKPTSEEWFGS